ncbi:MAG: DoxX family protein [Pseudomonadota bacterium]
MISAIDNALNPLRALAHNLGAPVFDLAARAYLAHAFFKSGLTRYNDWINGNFDSQIFLFELEHPVPGLDPETAAYLATGGELILPIILIFGLFGRFAAAGLLIMTAIIEFTYIHATEHILWAFLAASIFIKGPGVISLDHLIRKYLT